NDYLDPEADAWRDRTSLQVTFYPSHFSRLRLQGSWDRPTWDADPVFGAMLAVEVVIGAHGAHAY
ncbi:MAG: zinc-regulated TonB-dependent outer membrane receptor, partial [Deltaproteobacteria bacterium]|nr:zinc-regulated TonB-dependent outer membrane receptor [Deltaproteobacteria bacterium]